MWMGGEGPVMFNWVSWQSHLRALTSTQSLDERCNQILKNMEASLTARDRVGIQDFVLLDPYTSETAFLDNLRKRFHENLIYVSLSHTLVFDPITSSTFNPKSPSAASLNLLLVLLRLQLWFFLYMGWLPLRSVQPAGPWQVINSGDCCRWMDTAKSHEAVWCMDYTVPQTSKKHSFKSLWQKKKDFKIFKSFTEICVCLQTYIGTLLVSVNPYKELDIYNKKQMDIYMGVNFFELPPHMWVSSYLQILNKNKNLIPLLHLYSAITICIRWQLLATLMAIEVFGNINTNQRKNDGLWGHFSLNY